MPSNRELSDKASQLSARLGTSVETGGLNNRELADLVDSLQRQVDELDSAKPSEASLQHDLDALPPLPPELGDKPEPSFTPQQPSEVKPPSFEVAPGKSITSLRGILGPGTVVSAKDFTHGQGTIDYLVSANVVLKK